MTNQLIEILAENNRLLKEIKAILAMQLSSDYIAQQDMRAFGINVAADIFVELIENDKEFKDRLSSYFKK